MAGLDADAKDLEQILARARGRDASPSGDWKSPLDDPPQVHSGRRLKLITYVPGTRGLDAEFFRSRFGEPAAWLRENETAVSWFYPAIGLSVLIDDEANEVLEYQPPRDFIMPSGVSTAPTTP